MKDRCCAVVGIFLVNGKLAPNLGQQQQQQNKTKFCPHCHRVANQPTPAINDLTLLQAGDWALWHKHHTPLQEQCYLEEKKRLAQGCGTIAATVCQEWTFPDPNQMKGHDIKYSSLHGTIMTLISQLVLLESTVHLLAIQIKRTMLSL